ncbi:uncharacterized protein LOC125895673 isoform X2 [Epinephelus fuscoguttatus]|uniref:uncharacterized protein LOC125895673 isoform X2 n=1 Tax=Epinephelus fuscoguttatus TaxID=293821 RepID=UPI0020D1C133|nr:uncharacterized protein LOC125895673 isoform X2 [Epinephelus fuscoguttatus]
MLWFIGPSQGCSQPPADFGFCQPLWQVAGKKANFQPSPSASLARCLMMTCFSSSDPAAVNATLLFDLDNDDENLWTRSSHGGPLPLCSSPSSPPDFPCWVCLEQKVYAVCRNLTDGVKMMMEAGGVSVDLLKSDCPKPSSDGDGGASESQLLAIIIPILLLIIIFIGVLLYIFRKKSCWNPSEPNRVVVVRER